MSFIWSVLYRRVHCYIHCSGLRSCSRCRLTSSSHPNRTRPSPTHSRSNMRCRPLNPRTNPERVGGTLPTDYITPTILYHSFLHTHTHTSFLLFKVFHCLFINIFIPIVYNTHYTLSPCIKINNFTTFCSAFVYQFTITAKE